MRTGRHFIRDEVGSVTDTYIGIGFVNLFAGNCVEARHPTVKHLPLSTHRTYRDAMSEQTAGPRDRLSTARSE